MKTESKPEPTYKTTREFDIRRYASETLYNAIRHIIYKVNNPKLAPDDGLIVHELNKICDSLGIGIRHELDDDGNVGIYIDADTDAMRVLDVVYVFSAVYPNLMLESYDDCDKKRG